MILLVVRTKNVDDRDEDVKKFFELGLNQGESTVGEFLLVSQNCARNRMKHKTQEGVSFLEK